MDQSHEFRKIDDLSEHPLYHAYYPAVSESTIQRFIAAIQQSNYISPLIITSENVILDGHHRYWAAKRMGIETLPVTVKKIPEEEANYLLTTYNCARNNTRAEKIFLAKRIKAAMEYHGIKPGPKKCQDGIKVTADDIAKMFDMSRRAMFRALKLLDIIPELQNKFRKEEVGIRSVEKIANELDEQQQKTLYLKTINQRMTEEDLLPLIDEIHDEETSRSEAPYSLSTKVTIKKTRVIKDAEKDLKKLHEKVVLHTQIFKENPTAVHLILSGLEEIKRELEGISLG